ncbi:hypothetical protein NM208_g3484 [Fusarium decemcellulare]|uniref:Uncharacterized protein n=1 Tax=Fusarium decemcellulare TaxID=57161 RepID=A0ACC1SNY8_9HYPO|nr:hypothetical protein NM208_g3484 [Fusarium decemcellulare]
MIAGCIMLVRHGFRRIPVLAPSSKAFVGEASAGECSDVPTLPGSGSGSTQKTTSYLVSRWMTTAGAPDFLSTGNSSLLPVPKARKLTAMAAFANLRKAFDLTSRNYIVTGGAQGIGFAIVDAIAQMGGNVVAMDIKDKPGQDFSALSKQYGVNAQYIQADVTSEESLTGAFKKSINVLGGLDGCVTCAGLALEKPFEETGWQEARRIHDVNVTGTYFTAQLAASQMQKQGNGGSLVLISSITAHTVLPSHHMSAYGATKGAVKTLSESLAVELAPHRIRVNTISPGFIDTEMTQEVRKAKPSMAEVFEKRPPLQRMGRRDDLTGAVVYLLGDAASYTTGADIAITGGLHVGRINT